MPRFRSLLGRRGDSVLLGEGGPDDTLLGAGDSLLLEWMFSLLADLRPCTEKHADFHNQTWLHVKALQNAQIACWCKHLEAGSGS